MASTPTLSTAPVIAPLSAPTIPSAPPLAASATAARVALPTAPAASASAASGSTASLAPAHAAPAPPPAHTAPAPAPVAANTPTYDPSEEPFEFHGPLKKDGTFLGWGYSRHGDIQASVEVQHGRIVSAQIAQCLTRYPCDVIDKLPPQVVARQSADVDYVSGATESADAFYDAIIDALAKAR